MGWNCKYDKQIAKALGLFSIVVFFVGCKSFSSDTVKYVSLSNSTSNIIQGDTTGTFKGDKSRSAIIEEETTTINLEDVTFEPTYYSDKIFRQEVSLNSDFLEHFNSNSRAIGANLPADASTIQKDNTFEYMKNTSNSNQFYSCTAELKYSGNYCKVYSYDVDGVVGDSEFKNVADKFDSIYLFETEICGKNYLSSYIYSDIIRPDSTTKIDILIYDINSDKNSSMGVVGYFYGNDFLINQTTNYHSNERELFYVDSYWLADHPEEVYSTLAHEFSHMLNFVNKTCAYGKLYSTWYTEMLAMCVEDVLQDKLELSDDYAPRQRLNLFNCYSNVGFLTDEFFSSNNDFIPYVIYANTYAFGAFLMRNFGGAKLLNQIALNEYVDKESIAYALKSLSYNKDFKSAFIDFAEVLINYDNSYSDLCSLNKSWSGKISDSGETYNLTKIDLNNYYMYTDSSQTDKITGPLFYQSDYTDFDIYPGGMIVKALIANDSWTLEKKVVDKNENITYRLY